MGAASVGGRAGVERRPTRDAAGAGAFGRLVGGRSAVYAGRVGRFVERLASRHERRVRTTMAEALERAVADVDRPPRRGGAAVSVDRRGIAESASLLLEVAARLRAPAPLPTEALRLARSLTGDGASPLYARSAHRSEYPPGTLRRFASAVLAACEPREGAPAREPRVPIRS